MPPRKNVHKRLKTKELLPLLAFLALLTIILFLTNVGAIKSPNLKTLDKASTLSKDGLTRYGVGETIERAGYRVRFVNPRYEFDESTVMDSFKVDAALTNESFEPHIVPVFNCDIVDKGKMVKEGSGVLLNEIHELFPGESHDYVITIPLELDYTKESQSFSRDDGNAFPDRRVESCRFTPTGSYDPNISLEVVFD